MSSFHSHEIAEKIQLFTVLKQPCWLPIQEALRLIVSKPHPLTTHDFVALLTGIQVALTDGDKQVSIELFKDLPGIFQTIDEGIVAPFLQRTLHTICHELLEYIPTANNNGIDSFPYLYQSESQLISFTPTEVFHILSMMFLGIPLMGTSGKSIISTDTMKEFFVRIEESQVGKITCMLIYFNTFVAAKAKAFSNQLCREIMDENHRKIELQRVVLEKTNDQQKQRYWSSLQSVVLSEVEIRGNSGGGIESAVGTLQADFANKYIGGGVLHYGCVQEEIRFMLSPECLISVILSDEMLDHEAILLRNTIQYTSYTGYSYSFQCTGLSRTLQSAMEITSKDNNESSITLLPLDEIVAIDALPFGRNKSKQYQLPQILRELEKCRAGLSSSTSPGRTFATGNWGCGVFGGDAQLKSVIQWLACSACGMKMLYFPFHDPSTERLYDLAEIVKKRNFSVAQVFDNLIATLQEGKFKEKGGVLAALILKLSI